MADVEFARVLSRAIERSAYEFARNDPAPPAPIEHVTPDTACEFFEASKRMRAYLVFVSVLRRRDVGRWIAANRGEGAHDSEMALRLGVDMHHVAVARNLAHLADSMPEMNEVMERGLHNVTPNMQNKWLGVKPDFFAANVWTPHARDTVRVACAARIARAAAAAQ